MLELEQIGGEKVGGVRTPVSYNVYLSNPLVLIGTMYMEVGGYYVFEPKKNQSGYWNEELITSLGKALSKLNNVD